MINGLHSSTVELYINQVFNMLSHQTYCVKPYLQHTYDISARNTEMVTETNRAFCSNIKPWLRHKLSIKIDLPMFFYLQRQANLQSNSKTWRKQKYIMSSKRLRTSWANMGSETWAEHFKKSMLVRVNIESHAFDQIIKNNI